MGMAPGARLGSYEITASLGAGGMGEVYRAVWSPDGRQLVFSSEADGERRLLRRAADGTGELAVIAVFDRSLRRVQPTAWLPDGTLIVETETSEDEGDISVVPPGGDRRPIVRTAKFEGQSALSPDARWLAYASDESGMTQIYIQPFPGPGPRQQVPGPGWAPTWSGGGGELLYLVGGPATDVMRVDVNVDATGRLTVGTPEPLADFVFYDRRTTTRFYDAPAGGDRMLFISRSDELTEEGRHLRVVLNWGEEVRRLLARDQ